MTIFRTARAVLLAAALTAMSVAATSAHSQTVTPNGGDGGFTKPISNPWAQAHCHARSPEVLVTTAEHAANQFNPGGSFPCPEVANPGGQVHGD